MLTRRNVFGVMFSMVLVMSGFATTARAADDATGTWKYTMEARGNRPERTVTLKLKQEGDKLTGTINQGGNNAKDVDITDGKVKDGELSWTVTRKNQNGDEMKTTYTAKVSGDTLKGKTTFNAGGQDRSRDFEAKKAKE
jgi:hypothetical protein